MFLIRSMSGIMVCKIKIGPKKLSPVWIFRGKNESFSLFPEPVEKCWKMFNLQWLSWQLLIPVIYDLKLRLEFQVEELPQP